MKARRRNRSDVKFHRERGKRLVEPMTHDEGDSG